MSGMKAISFARYGRPEVLDLCELERPKTGHGEILLRVSAIGVNPADHKFRAGALAAHRPKVLPLVPGMDVAGTVVETGPGVTTLAVGDLAFGMLPPARLGGYAEFVAASAGLFAKIPTGISTEAAAALPTPGLTGVEMIEDDLQAQPGQSILVIGALGAVGRAAVFAARRRGCHVTAAVRPDRIDEVTFADAVIDINRPQSGQFAAIADTVGGEIAGCFVDNLAPGGVMSTVSTVKIPPSTRSDVIVRSFVCYPDTQRLADLALGVVDGFPLLPPVEIARLASASDIHQRMEAGARNKFVLVP